MSFFPIYFFDMQNEKDYINHYKEFLRIPDFEIRFHKITGAILVLEILNININL